MVDNDAARTDLYTDMQHTVSPDPCPTRTMRCPRCERAVDPADLSVQSLGELRLIDPHGARYDRQPFFEREGIALCDACVCQLDAIAQEMDAYRRRLTQLWPRPTSHSGRLMDDQRLSRTFEAIRDTAIEDVLGWAIWYDRRGHDTYLVVYETGEWAIQPVPRGQVYDVADDRGYLALPLPVALPTADDGDDDEETGVALVGSTLREIDVAALYRHRAPSDADHEPLEMDLTTRFYRTLYSEEELAR